MAASIFSRQLYTFQQEGGCILLLLCRTNETVVTRGGAQGSEKGFDYQVLLVLCLDDVRTTLGVNKSSRHCGPFSQAHGKSLIRLKNPSTHERVSNTAAVLIGSRHHVGSLALVTYGTIPLLAA